MNLKLAMYHDRGTFESFKKFCGISDIDDVSMTPSMSDFYVVLPYFATASVIKVIETFDFHIGYMIVCTTLPSRMYNRLCVC